MTTLFFETDVHGLDICWSKFLNVGEFYGVNKLILDGDMTGKAAVPFVHQGGKNYRITLLEQVFDATNEEELAGLVKRVRSPSYSPYMNTPKKLQNLFLKT